ncbi:MAG TPA: glycosyltransferase family 39 protein [Candidatus Eisenbacteria bacterium]|nr:glycosyltransferase family 39 protein [Candidatus Eisenbacteria bacterium]
MIRRLPAAAWAIPALALLLTCGLFGLFEPTETRYAEIAREMLRSGDWLVPRLNGITHFHKPPVAYWGAAAGMSVAGANEWGARLFGALAAGFILWGAVRLARRLEGAAAAAIAPVLLASTALFVALSRQLATDLPLTACVVGFWVAYLDARDRGGSRSWPLFAALALGFMTKGPVVFLHTLLPLLGAGFLARGARVWTPLRSAGGWAFFALLALPWYLIVVFRHEGLFTFFVADQIWARYATTVHGRAGPWYYFAGVLAAGALPWTIAAVAELTRRARGTLAALREREPIPFETALLLSWAILPTAFFSTSGSKLPAYVLPETVPIAILVGAALARSPRAFGWSAALPLLALAAATEWFGPAALAKAVGATMTASLALPAAAHVAVAAWVVAAFFLFAGRARAGAWCVWAAFLACVFAVAPLDGPFGSPRALAHLVKGARAAEEPLVEYGEFNAGLPFYLETHALLVEVPRDLRFEGEDGHPVVRHAAEIAALARRHGRVWLYARRGEAAALADRLGLVAEPVATWRGREMTVLRPME